MKMKKIIEMIIVFFAIFGGTLFLNNVYATDEFELNLETSQDSIKKGETITLNIILDNLNVESGDKGIGAYKATLVYDTNVFSKIQNVSSNDWEISENEGNIVAVKKDGKCVTNKTNTATITLEVNEMAKEGITELYFEKITGSSGETIIGKSKVAQVKITDKVIQDNETANKNEPIKTENIINKNVFIDNRIANKKLPKAGIYNYIFIGVAILLIVASISYVKYRE